MLRISTEAHYGQQSEAGRILIRTKVLD